MTEWRKVPEEELQEYAQTIAKSLMERAVGDDVPIQDRVKALKSLMKMAGLIKQDDA